MVIAIYSLTAPAQWLLAVSSTIAAVYIIKLVNGILKRNRIKDAEQLYMRYQMEALIHAHKKQDNGAGKLFTKNFDDKMDELVKKKKTIQELTDEV